MDELEIKLVITFRIPKTDLTLNGALRGLAEVKNNIMSTLTQATFGALETMFIAECQAREPGRYVRHGRQGRARKFNLPRVDFEAAFPLFGTKDARGFSPRCFVPTRPILQIGSCQEEGLKSRVPP